MINDRSKIVRRKIPYSVLFNMSSFTDFFSTPTFKLILLAGMVLQNSVTVLVGRYTRSGVRVEDRYVVSHLLLVTEMGKLLLSCVFEYFGTNGGLVESFRSNIVDRPFDALKIMIPAVLYLVQNNLLYLALSNLTAPLFQVTYQGKLVTTAIISVIMLNRKYSLQQWICLVALSLGVAIVVLDEKKEGSSNENEKEEKTPESLVVGLISVTVACVSSALAGVYFEKVVKTSSTGDNQKPVSVWMRNIQLAFFTIITILFQGMWSKEDENSAASQYYFHGFTSWAWVLVCLQAGGGLLVAAVIKYADNVLKGLATGVSVCFATVMSAMLFGTPISGQFSVGALMILLSVYIFSNPINTKEKMHVPSSMDSSTEMKGILPK